MFFMDLQREEITTHFPFLFYFLGIVTLDSFTGVCPKQRRQQDPCLSQITRLQSSSNPVIGLWENFLKGK